MTNSHPVSVVSLLLLSTLVAGCIQDTGPDVESEPEWVRPIGQPLGNALVINETVDPTGFWFRFVALEDCQTTPLPYVFYKLHDRFGAVAQEILPVDLDTSEPQDFWIPLVGTAPWIFFGHPNPCNDIARSYSLGITNGTATFGIGLWTYHPEARGHAAANEMVFEDVVRVRLEAGETHATGTWTDDAFYTWDLVWGFVDAPRGPDGFWGTIKMYYPDDSLWREDWFGITGRRGGTFDAIQYMPGEYRIEVQAEVPVAQTLEIEYYIQYMALTPHLCIFGFEWEMCGGTYDQ